LNSEDSVVVDID